MFFALSSAPMLRPSPPLSLPLTLSLKMNACSEKMSALFQELKLSDGRRIDACKTMLLDWLIAEKQMLQTQQKVSAGVLSFFRFEPLPRFLPLFFLIISESWPLFVCCDFFRLFAVFCCCIFSHFGMSAPFIHFPLFSPGAFHPLSLPSLISLCSSPPRPTPTHPQLTDQAINAVKGIDRERDVADWVRASQFVINEQGATVWDQVCNTQCVRKIPSLVMAAKLQY